MCMVISTDFAKSLFGALRWSIICADVAPSCRRLSFLGQTVTRENRDLQLYTLGEGWKCLEHEIRKKARRAAEPDRRKEPDPRGRVPPV